ncbi:response regulator [Aeromicrobium sp. CF4.19]|uniref:response regulator n=1 Tax=Aeromicrobium sp. CF4.19 TaxID=3373082 RepID=UPI003EE692A3
MTRVLICDDDALVRAGLGLMLGGETDIEVVGEVGDGRAALDGVLAGGVDLVLMDLRMPVMDGIEATRAIVDMDVDVKIIVLTTFDADEYVVRALAAGAHGFLLKDTAPQQIVASIRTVVAGEPALSPEITRRLIEQVTDASDVDDPRAQRASALVTTLTDREREVALAIGRGASNAEIAAALHLSLATVKAHISHLFTKLGTTNRVQVAICMHEAGLL